MIKNIISSLFVLTLIIGSFNAAEARNLSRSVSLADKMSKAVYHNDMQTVLSIADNFDVNTLNSSGNNALHLAAAHGSLPISTALIHKGANPNIVNRSGLTALDISVIYNRGFIYELLAPITTRKKKEHYKLGQLDSNIDILGDHYVVTLSDNIFDSFVEPTQVFANNHAPAVQYQAPALNYEVREVQYQAPVIEYQAPQVQYQPPVVTMQQPAPTAVEPMPIIEPAPIAETGPIQLRPLPPAPSAYQPTVYEGTNGYTISNIDQARIDEGLTVTGTQQQPTVPYFPDEISSQMPTNPQYIDIEDVILPGAEPMPMPPVQPQVIQPAEPYYMPQPVAPNTLPEYQPQINQYQPPQYPRPWPVEYQPNTYNTPSTNNPQFSSRGRQPYMVEEDGDLSSLEWAGIIALGAGATAAIAAIVTSNSDEAPSQGGGGSTGGGTTPNFAAERTSSNFLPQINAQAAYDAGVTGDSVTVAVIDSGVDRSHLDFTGRISNTSLNILGDADGHGTEVAGIVAANRDGIGMHGVAFEAGILPIQIGFDGQAGQNSLVQAFNGAINNGARIINNSYSTGGVLNPNSPTQATEVNITFASEIPVWRNITDLNNPNRAIVVFSAGNDSLSEVEIEAGLPFHLPELKELWVASVAVNSSNTIAGFSHSCGAAAEWCIAAPGVSLFTSTTGGGYTTQSGTSASAPVVSGALALILDSAPNISPEQAVDILFDSATDLGAAGVDPVYGNGLVNIAAALAPMGTSSVVTPNALINIAENSVISGSGSLTNTLANNSASFAFVDSFNRPYYANINNYVNSQRDSSRFLSSLQKFGVDKFNNKVSLNDLGEIAVSVSESGAQNSSQYFEALPDSQSKQNVRLKYSNKLNLGDGDFIKLGMARGSSLEDFSFNDGSLIESAKSMFEGSSAGVVENRNFMSFGDDGNIISAGVKFGKTAYGFTAFTNKNENLSDNDISKFVNYASYAFDSGTSLKFNLGAAFEEDSLFNNRFDGAFNLGNGNETYFTGLGISQNLSKKTAIGLEASMGVTKGKNIANSLFTKHSDLVANSIEANLVSKSLFSEGDILGLRVFQPMRVLDGSISYNKANLIDPKTVSFAYNQEDISLKPNATEIDFEAVYGFNLGDGKVLTNALYRVNPNHYSGNKDEAAFLLKYSTEF